MTLADEIIYGTKENIERSIASGADLNEVDAYGLTPLIETVVVNRPDITELLIDSGAAINQKDLTGRTALHWATDFYNLPICKLLLKNNADANAYTRAGEPVMVNPVLRQQYDLRRLLHSYGGRLTFAQDFINTKLIGHRYELQGEVDIVNAKNQFIEIEFEGFFLEFTLEMIRDSLFRYKNNFSARHMRENFNYITQIISTLDTASQLIKFQQHTLNIADYTDQIKALLKTRLLLIPVCYAGHAITFVKYNHTLIKIDRGENGRHEGSVLIYEVGRPELIDDELIMNLIYQRQQKDFIHGGINKYLHLDPIAIMPLDPQITGNCSWANVEGAVPAMFFVLLAAHHANIKENLQKSLKFYCDWLEWDKDRALEECIDSFHQANEPRRLSKAAVMAAVLFQACQYNLPTDMTRAEKILKILTLPEITPILKSYQKTYAANDTHVAKNFRKILDYFDVKL